MTNLTYLIKKNGKKVKLNDEDAYLSVDAHSSSLYSKEYSHVTSLSIIRGLCSSTVRYSDVFEIDGDKYLVYHSKDFQKGDNVAYSDVVLFKDDFDKTINIYYGDVSSNINNYPVKGDLLLEIKSKVRVISQSERLELPFYYDNLVPTHIIYIPFSESFDMNIIQPTYRIEWGTRWFTICAKENHKEADVLMLLYCAETLKPDKNNVCLNKIIYENLKKALVDKLKSNMDTISYGRVYTRGTRTHIASKEYDPPNNYSGNLRSTIGGHTRGKHLVIGSGNSGINYAKYLELGTRYMAPRPNLFTVINKNRDLVEASIRTSILEYLKIMKGR